MNIVFFGTAEFAIEPLRALIRSRHKVIALVTQPDRKKGRTLKLSPPLTKVLAQTEGIPVYQPSNVSGPESVGHLRNLNADLFVVIAFGQILKKDILCLPKLFSINLHGSLLPKYRGAAPTNWAIIKGETRSGVTIIKMNEKMDEGDIVSSAEIPVEPDDTNITLSEKLSSLGTKLLLETMDSLESGGKAVFSKQDDSAATYAPKLKKEDGLIDWGKSAMQIHNMVRGFLPWPGAYTYYNKKILKVMRTSLVQYPVNKSARPGEVVDISEDKGIIVQTGSDVIAVTHLQLEGKKVLDAPSFVRGHRIEKGYDFSDIA